jgi:microcystin-dependent protein
LTIVVSNIGLRIWNLGQDPYNHQQLADNFAKIDQHDHSPGRGRPLGTSALQDGSITLSKMAANSVGTTQLIDGSVTTSKLADGAVTAAKLAPTAFDKVTPLGTVIDWWRPSGTYDAGAGAGNPPPGYEICDGRTLTSGQHDFGGGSLLLPDLRNKYTLGADITKTDGTFVSAGGDPVSDSPGIGGSGGSNRVTLATADIPSHSHTVSGNTGNSNVSLNHSHTGTTGGENSSLGHAHGIDYHIDVGIAAGSDFSISGLTFAHPDQAKGPLNTWDGGPGVHTHSFTSDASDLTGHSHPINFASQTTGGGGSHENRPHSVGLLKIMKVKRG